MRDLKITYLINNRILAYEISTPIKTVSGLDNLIQRISKLILTATGSNPLEPDLGTGFGHLAGNVNIESEEVVKNNIPVMVESLKTQLLKEQYKAEDNGQRFSDEEYLVNLSLKSVQYDPIYNGFIIELLITNRANNSITVTLP